MVKRCGNICLLRIFMDQFCKVTSISNMKKIYAFSFCWKLIFKKYLKLMKFCKTWHFLYMTIQIEKSMYIICEKTQQSVISYKESKKFLLLGDSCDMLSFLVSSGGNSCKAVTIFWTQKKAVIMWRLRNKWSCPTP